MSSRLSINSTTTPERLRWLHDARFRYLMMTPRQLAVELLELGVEISEAEAYDPVAREVVDLLAGERLRLARIELRRRIAGDRA